MRLVDTSVWIEVFRKPPRYRLTPADLEDMVTCLPIVQEVLQGFQDERAFRIAREALFSLPVVESPLRAVLFEEAAHLYRSARRAGITVRSGVECLIAACALRHDLLVLHVDRDYEALAMAETVNAASLRARKAELPGVPVVAYVNSTADVKAESHICCTSANAVKVVNSLSEPRVLMVPDRNLALYTARHTQKEVLLWQGCCNIHDALTAAEVKACRAAHPQAVFLAHPDCRPEVLDLADVIRSTSGMLEYARRSEDREFIIGTEMGIIHTLQQQNPGKLFYPPSERLLCPDMKRITLDDLLTALREDRHQITLPEDTRLRARRTGRACRPCSQRVPQHDDDKEVGQGEGENHFQTSLMRASKR